MAQMLQYCHAELLGHQIEKPHKSVKWIITHTDGLKSLAFRMKQLFFNIVAVLLQKNPAAFFACCVRDVLYTK